MRVQYFQVNTGVSYLLDYVEDFYRMMVVLSAPVSILNPNPMCLPLSLDVLYLKAAVNTV